MAIDVTGLGAWCDFVTEDEHRLAMTRVGWLPSDVEDLVENFAKSLHFRVEEFATLSDGRRLTLAPERSWGSRSSSSGPVAEQWARLTVDDVVKQVHNVVLPDDAEQTGDAHPWSSLVERLELQGVHTTREELEQLPYDVELSDRLRDKLVRDR